jgi:hypothetical protein
MQSERLDFLIRKNKGKLKLNEYKHFFKEFNLKGLEYIELEESDQILKRVRSTFLSIERECEMIKNESSNNSSLLNEVLNRANNNESCYIFTDDVYQCGIFKANSKSALNECLNVAFLAYEHTCFVVDHQFKFSFLINYCNEFANQDKNTFDIQRRVLNSKSENEFER